MIGSSWFKLSGFLASFILLTPAFAQMAPPQAGLGGDDTGSQRTPQEDAHEGLRWLGTLEPLMQTCKAPPEVISPFHNLGDLMSQAAQKRGVATLAQTKSWLQEGIVDGKSRVAALSSAGMMDSSCKNILAELQRQAPVVSATVSKLHDYLLQNPAGVAPKT